MSLHKIIVEREKLREEFKNTLGNKLAYIGSSGQEHLDKIADFWLSKIDQIRIADLEAQKEKCVEEINSLPMDFANDGKYTDKKLIEVMSNVIKRQSATLSDLKEWIENELKVIKKL